MGMLLAGLAGAATGLATLSAEQQKYQAELDKETRIRAADREDAKVANDNAVAAAKTTNDNHVTAAKTSNDNSVLAASTLHTNNVEDNLQSHKWDLSNHATSRKETLADHDTSISDAITLNKQRIEDDRVKEEEAFRHSVDPKRLEETRKAKIGDQNSVDTYKDSRFPTLVEQTTKLNAITDHHSDTEQKLKEAILQKSLDATNIPESIKEDNKGIKDELAQNKASRTAMEANGTLDAQSRTILDNADNVLWGRLHDNIRPYLPKGTDDPRGIKEKAPGKYDAVVHKVAEENGIPRTLYASLINAESSGQQFGSDGSVLVPADDGKPHSNVGLAQVSTKWFPQYDAQKLKNDPEYNARAGAEILKGLYNKTDEKLGDTARWHQALQAYHEGPTGAGNQAGIDYANNVLGKWTTANEYDTKRLLTQLTAKPAEAPDGGMLTAGAAPAPVVAGNNPGLLSNLIQPTASMKKPEVLPKEQMSYFNSLDDKQQRDFMALSPGNRTAKIALENAGYKDNT